jgi:hypothetical protein
MAGTFELERNVGPTDRFVRIAAGGLMLAWSAARMAREADMTALGLGLFGGVTLAEGVLGTCLLYSAMGIDTREPAWPYNGAIADERQGI